MDRSAICKGKEVYWARCIPTCDEYYVVKLTIHSVQDDYFTGLHPLMKTTHLFKYSDLDKVIYEDQLSAQEYCSIVEEKFKKR